MKKSLKIINGIAIVLLVALFVVIDCVLFRYKNQVTMFLCGNGTDYNSKEYREQKDESNKLATRIAEEGIVMLKNENNVLPLTDTTALNVFGWSGCDNGMIYMGFGSGTASTYNQISIYKALREIGFDLNEELCTLYNEQSFRRDTGWAASSYKMYEPNELLTDSVMNKAKDFSDTALIVLARFGMEAYDLPNNQRTETGASANNGRTYLEITPAEEELIAKVTDKFDKVIVVINSANAMELGFLDNEKIDAALDIYFPGNNGANALASILCGAVTPSGHTVDTFAYDHSTAAAYANNGAEANTYTDFSKGYYVDYAENIYTGYYWYETADAEGFWTSDYAKKKWNLKNGYNDVVQYPFGYGLSYAAFDWEVTSVNFKDGEQLKKDAEAEVKVRVTNTHKEYAGADVVQLYFTAPYYKGGIEKPSLKLCGFAKTTTLEPGQSQELSIKVSLRDMASYDCYDKNDNGFAGYELEGGEYTLTLRTDAHTVKAIDKSTLRFVVPSNDSFHTGYKYETDETTGNTVSNLFTTFKNEKSGAQSKITEKAISAKSEAYSIDGTDSGQNITFLTRNDFVSTFPQKAVQRGVSDEFRQKTYDNSDSPVVYEEDKAPVFGDTSVNLTVDDMLITEEKDGEKKIVGLVDYDDEKWDKLVSRLTVKEVADLCGDGGLKTIAIKSINKDACIDSDGPSGFNTTIFGSDKYGGYAASYPCEVMIASTWNKEMAYLMGRSVGGEAFAAKIQGWYGPACNIHRTPYGGRNYEYYSEDPFISGVMVAYTVIGAKEQGLYAYVKHFAVNETEVVRSAGYTWLTEQAFREIYASPFESAVKTGGTLGIMSSYNRIGSTRTSGSYNLLTNLLRKEWGFKGCVISDYNNEIPVLCPDEAIRAGNNLMMEASGGAKMFADKSSGTALKNLHEGAKNVLYCYTAAKYYKATSKGLSLDAVIDSSTRNDVFVWWVPVLVIVNVLALLGAADWTIRIFFPTLYEKINKGLKRSDKQTE